MTTTKEIRDRQKQAMGLTGPALSRRAKLKITCWHKKKGERTMYAQGIGNVHDTGHVSAGMRCVIDDGGVSHWVAERDIYDSEAEYDEAEAAAGTVSDPGD